MGGDSKTVEGKVKVTLQRVESSGAALHLISLIQNQVSRRTEGNSQSKQFALWIISCNSDILLFRAGPLGLHTDSISAHRNKNLRLFPVSVCLYMLLCGFPVPCLASADSCNKCMVDCSLLTCSYPYIGREGVPLL